MCSRSEEFLRAEGAFERRHHAVTPERMLVAEKVNHPVDIASARFHVVVIVHLGLEVNLSEPIQIDERVANLRWHVLDCAVTLDERQRLLWSDAVDAWMKIGPDEQAGICDRSTYRPSPLLRGLLLFGGSPLENPLRPLELSAPSRAEVLSATIDEVLNHPDSGSKTTRRHILACHGPRNLGRGTRECSRRWMCGIRGDGSDPPPLLCPALRRG
jgi:hypothetical protein